MSLIEELVGRNNLLTQRNIDALEKLTLKIAGPQQVQLGPGTPTTFTTDIRLREIDLTTAHSNMEIGCGSCDYITAWTDGGLDGISVKVGKQDAPSLYFSLFNPLPVNNPEKLWLTSDVRIGRTKLILVFTTGAPLMPQLYGAGITRSEMAARSGSINVYDRRGETIFMDDFENGLNNWVASKSGLGSSVALSVLSSLRGSTSVKLVGGSDNDQYAQILHYMAPAINVTPMGLELAASLDTNVDEIQCLFDYYTGAIQASFGVKYDLTNTTAAVLTASGTWTNVGSTVTPYAHDKNYSLMKVVFDPSTLEYHRFTLNHLDPTVKPLVGFIAAPVVTNPHATVRIKVLSNAAANGVSYIDNFIATVNEPV